MILEHTEDQNRGQTLLEAKFLLLSATNLTQKEPTTVMVHTALKLAQAAAKDIPDAATRKGHLENLDKLLTQYGKGFGLDRYLTRLSEAPSDEEIAHAMRSTKPFLPSLNMLSFMPEAFVEMALAPLKSFLKADEDSHSAEASKTAGEAPDTTDEAPKTADEAPDTTDEAPKTTDEATNTIEKP